MQKLQKEQGVELQTIKSVLYDLPVMEFSYPSNDKTLDEIIEVHRKALQKSSFGNDYASGTDHDGSIKRLKLTPIQDMP
ncbi:MAG: hypothetical protein WA432_03840 [Candidatus Babeliaceae bacterium]